VISYDLMIDKGRNALRLPSYTPSRRASAVLKSGGIISEREMPQDLLVRVISTLFSVEAVFDTPWENVREIAEEFSTYVVKGNVMLGTPMLTNAGRYESALSSCTVAPVDLRPSNEAVKELIRSYYRQNMGIGFNFTPYEDPVALLSRVDEFSAQEETTGEHNRYIGNMGMLHVSHPRIREFIEAKRRRDMRHFNLSVDVTEEFMERAEKGATFALSNGSRVDADDVLRCMAENAWYNGDPGLIYLERMNRDNPVAALSKHVCTPPCAEMGLMEGETCHFGYLNLHSFVRKRDQEVEIDYNGLGRVTQLLTRVLDNAVEYSISRYPTSASADVARKNRKIGIGACGLADMFLEFSLPYDSQAARNLARDVLSFITYASKCASVELADQRGSCQAMNSSRGNSYLEGSFLEEKYGRHPSRTVSSHEWKHLAERIRTTGKLRNLLTTALPPTGRASILLDVTSSIEPMFSVFDSDGGIQANIVAFLKRELGGDEVLLGDICQKAELAESFQSIDVLSSYSRACLKTAKEISSMAHVQMVAAVAGLDGVVDESASKTVNLPHHATVEDVKSILFASYHLGLKNISIYRDNTKPDQPVYL
jgi:ribonucleoside-diphosphate reductase alpha chain